MKMVITFKCYLLIICGFVCASAAPSDAQGGNMFWGQGSAADYLATNPIIQQCCACGRANYRINFGATWDQGSIINGKTPFGYITPKWQSLIGASHDDTFSLWRYEELAPDHIRQDMSANPGKIQPQNIQNFLKENYRSVRTVIRMPDIPTSIGDASAQFSVDKKYHLASFLAFMSPSPDWFVGFNAVDLCHTDCTWKEKISLNLYPIDAGTHSGDHFLSSRNLLSQREKVQDLRFLNRNNSNSPFYEEVRNTIPSFANVELVRTAVRDDTCQANNNYNPAFSSNQGDGIGIQINGPHDEVADGCFMTFWSEWTQCLSCDDKMIRQRDIVNSFIKCAAQELIQFENCANVLKECKKKT